MNVDDAYAITARLTKNETRVLLTITDLELGGSLSAPMKPEQAVELASLLFKLAASVGKESVRARRP